VLTHKLPLKHELAQHIADVLISSPADGQVLTYEAASAKWKNKAAALTRTLYEVNPASYSTTSGVWVQWPGSVISFSHSDVRSHMLFYSVWVWNDTANDGGECCLRQNGSVVARTRRGWLGAIALQDQCLSAIVLLKDQPAGSYTYDAAVRRSVGGTATFASYNDIVIEVI